MFLLRDVGVNVEIIVCVNVVEQKLFLLNMVQFVVGNWYLLLLTSLKTTILFGSKCFSFHVFDVFILFAGIVTDNIMLMEKEEIMVIKVYQWLVFYKMATMWQRKMLRITCFHLGLLWCQPKISCVILKSMHIPFEIVDFKFILRSVTFCIPIT